MTHTLQHALICQPKGPTRQSSAFFTWDLSVVVLWQQYRADGIKVRDKFVRPLQDLAASMSLAAQSNYGKTARDFKSSSILEISTIQESFRKLRASLCSFSCYVPQQFIQSQIREHADIGLSISRCQGSVLFSDIASFTSISESLEPKRLHQVCFLNLRRIYVGCTVVSLLCCCLYPLEAQLLILTLCRHFFQT